VPVLTGVDVLAVQRFVFASNRLRDVAAASWLLEQVTRGDVVGHAQEAGGDALTAAGAVAVLRFADRAAAARFATSYTRHLLEKLPEADVALVHREYPDGALARALLAVQVDLARAKTEFLPSVPLRGLAVTAACRDTGLPAVAVLPDPEQAAVPLAAVPAEGRRLRNEVRGQHDQVLKDARAALPPTRELPDRMAFPLLTDDVAGSSAGDRSEVAVVHVDGNQIGALISGRLTKLAQRAVSDGEVAEEYRLLSKGLSERGEAMLTAVARHTVDAVVPTDREDGPRWLVAGTVPELAVPLAVAEDGAVQLPLRPVLLGGDDLTLVCDGRIALDLAAMAVRAFAAPLATAGHRGQFSACAGVAVVPAHAPFLPAYQLAAELCTSAKARWRTGGQVGGALDWHLGSVAPGQSVVVLRSARTNTGQQLTCRPYTIGNGAGVTSWEWLRDTLLPALRGDGWKQRRSKVHALAVAVPSGPGAVHDLLEAWRVVTPDLRLPPPLDDDDPFGGTAGTPLLDAAELLDRAQFLVPIGTGP